MVNNLSMNAGVIRDQRDAGFIPGSGRSPGEGPGNPLQYSGLENSMGSTVAKSRTRLSDFHLDIIRLFIVHSSAGFVEYFQGRVTILRVCVPRQSLNGV